MPILSAAHDVLVALYAALPAAALIVAFRRGRREKSSAPLRNFMGALGLGSVLAACFCTAYAAAVGGRPHPTGVGLTVYFATALLLLLRLFDRFITAVLNLLARPISSTGFRVTVVSILRLVVLTLVIIPYVTAAAFTYRPQLMYPDPPAAVVDAGASAVSFRSTDGIRLSGWWFPAARHSSETILLCPGIGPGKRSVAGLARALAAGDFNVLAIDLRATGESGGHITTYGDLERRDVAGALDWINDQHPELADKIYGVGIGPGGAALIAAATKTVQGRNLAALAVADTFADFPGLARDLADDYLGQPFAFLIGRGSVPLATVQTGAALDRFNPAALARDLWPRPLLVIAAEQSRLVPFDQAQSLYFGATAPKDFLQVGAGEPQLLRNRSVAATIIEFLRNAEPLPVI